MQYAIWILSLFVGIGLALTGNPIGWLVFAGGTLAGFLVSRKKTEDRQARKIAKVLDE